MCKQASADYNKKQEITVKPKLDVSYDDFNFSVSGKSDLKTVSETWPQFVYTPSNKKESVYWARADLTRNLAMAGCDQKLKDGIQHSWEAIFGWNKLQGLMGYPVILRGGVAYQLGDKTETTTTASVGQFWELYNTVQHKVDDHWTVSCTQSFKSSFAAEKKSSPYHVGFAASYKL